MPEVLAPCLVLFRGVAQLLAETSQRLAQAVRVEVRETCIGEGFPEDSADRAGALPAGAGQTHGLELVAGILLVLSGRKEWIVQTGSYPEPHGLLTSEQSSIASSMVAENDVVLCSKRTCREGRGHKSWSQDGHRSQNQPIKPSGPITQKELNDQVSPGPRHKKTRNYAGLSDIIQRLDLQKELVAMGGLEPPTPAL